MDKMKMQDAQLTQASGATTSTGDDQQLLLQPTAQAAKALQVKGQTDHLGRACRSTRLEPFIPTAMCKPTSTSIIGSSSIHVHQLISFVINPMCATCTK